MPCIGLGTWYTVPSSGEVALVMLDVVRLTPKCLAELTWWQERERVGQSVFQFMLDVVRLTPKCLAELTCKGE